MSTDEITNDDVALRELAVKQIKKQSDFLLHMLIYVLVNSFLVTIWAMNNTTFFWPMFAIFGWGIGLAANAWDAYSTDVPTERKIRDEMQRLRNRN